MMQNIREIIEEQLGGAIPQAGVDRLVRRVSKRVDEVREQARNDGYRQGYDQGWADHITMMFEREK